MLAGTVGVPLGTHGTPHGRPMHVSAVCIINLVQSHTAQGVLEYLVSSEKCIEVIHQSQSSHPFVVEVNTVVRIS